MSNFNGIWFTVIQWPDDGWDGPNHTEISHFSSKEVAEKLLKEHLESILEEKFETLDDAFKKAEFRKFSVWGPTLAKVRTFPTYKRGLIKNDNP